MGGRSASHGVVEKEAVSRPLVSEVARKEEPSG